MTRTLATLLALSAAPALAQDLSPKAVTLAAAIERAGCVVDNSNGNRLVERTGLTEAEVYATVAELYQAGLLKMEDNGTARLYTAECQ